MRTCNFCNKLTFSDYVEQGFSSTTLMCECPNGLEELLFRIQDIEICIAQKQDPFRCGPEFREISRRAQETQGKRHDCNRKDEIPLNQSEECCLHEIDLSSMIVERRAEELANKILKDVMDDVLACIRIRTSWMGGPLREDREKLINKITKIFLQATTKEDK